MDMKNFFERVSKLRYNVQNIQIVYSKIKTQKQDMFKTILSTIPLMCHPYCITDWCWRLFKTHMSPAMSYIIDK